MFCERCGNDKPWSSADWTMSKGLAYCCGYCRDVYEAAQVRYVLKGKKNKKL